MWICGYIYGGFDANISFTRIFAKLSPLIHRQTKVIPTYPQSYPRTYPPKLVVSHEKSIVKSPNLIRTEGNHGYLRFLYWRMSLKQGLISPFSVPKVGYFPF